MVIDTHVLVWAAMEPERLGPQTRELLITQPLRVATITAHELARLIADNRLQLKRPLDHWLETATRQLQLDWIPLDVATALESYRLPQFEHRDPCDRILVATARIRNLSLITADEALLSYRDVRCHDARL